MEQITVTQFRDRMDEEVERVVVGHETLQVTCPHGGDFVVVSAEDWRAIQETLFLNRLPGMTESLHAAAEEPLSAGLPMEKLEW